MKKFSKKNIKKNLHSSRFNKKTKNIIKTKKLKRKINNMKGGMINWDLKRIINDVFNPRKYRTNDTVEDVIEHVNRIYNAMYSTRIQQSQDAAIKMQQKIKFNNSVAWAIPTMNILNYIKNIVGDDSILEIGAGYGLWAACLKMIGCNIIPTDDYSWMKNNKDKDKETYIDIENISYGDALKKYDKCKILFLCWPPPKDDLPYKIIQQFTEGNNGQILIYIGDGQTGEDSLTGGLNFFEYLDEKWKNETEEYTNIIKFFKPSRKNLNTMSNDAKSDIVDEVLAMPKWYSDYTCINIFRRKSKIQNI